jgi:signal transduction histidine kinase
MASFLLHPLIYTTAGMIALLLLSFFLPSYLWMGILITLCSIPAWFVRKRWIAIETNNTRSLILEEDFVP